MFWGWIQQRYVELFRSTKGEMMTAVQQRMYGMFSGAGGFSQFGVGQVRESNRSGFVVGSGQLRYVNIGNSKICQVR